MMTASVVSFPLWRVEEERVAVPRVTPRMRYNLKPRLVTCLTCRYDVLTAVPGPSCLTCGNWLYTVCHSLLNGRRLTGENLWTVHHL